jgi:hypothetical protein
MSKTQDKKLKNKVEHAEFLWNEAQMKAAAMQQILDIAIAEFEEHQEELEAEVVATITEQIAIRKKDIEDYLMGEKNKFIERIRVDVDKTR